MKSRLGVRKDVLDSESFYLQRICRTLEMKRHFILWASLILIENNLGHKGFIWLRLLGHWPLLKEGRTGTQPEPKADTTVEAACWLTHRLILSLLSYTVQDLLTQGGGASNSGLGFPTSVNSREGPSQTCSQTKCLKAQLRLSFRWF